MLTQTKQPKTTVTLDTASRPRQISALSAEGAVAPAKPHIEKPRITEELLIEEVSIDGMCGVY